MRKMTALLILICMSMAREAAMSIEEFFKLCREGTPQQIEAAIKEGGDVMCNWG